MGIPQGTEITRLNNILNTWLGSLRTTKKSTGSRLNISYQTTAIQGDWQDVLGLSDGVTVAATRSLPWLEWILEAGAAATVLNYSVVYGSFPGSRSGGGIMVVTPQIHFNVAEEFQGTTNDNFITRALDSMIKDNGLTLELKGIVKNALQ